MQFLHSRASSCIKLKFASGLEPMSVASPHRPTLRVVAAFSRYPEAIEWARQTTAAAWGPIALESELFDHHETNYYEATMGRDLKKTFFAFETLVDPAGLVEW